MNLGTPIQFRKATNAEKKKGFQLIQATVHVVSPIVGTCCQLVPVRRAPSARDKALPRGKRGLLVPTAARTATQ